MLHRALQVTACILICIVLPPLAYGAGYLAGINTDGTDNPWGISSGTLPGLSPAAAALPGAAPGLMRAASGPLPGWSEPQRPEPGPALLQSTRTRIEKQQRSVQAPSLKTYSTGEQKSFWVQDANDPDWRQVTATCEKVSEHGYIFVDNTLAVPDAALQLYADEFDVIYDVLADNIGTFSDRDGNGKVAILLYGMNDGGTIYGYYAGYFWGRDYLSDADAPNSNEMDLIYIRGNLPDGWDPGLYGDFYTYNLTTLAHEYQHMVHFSLLAWSTRRYTTADTWINEMMATAAETMYFKAKLAADPAFTHEDMLPGGYLASRVYYYSTDKNESIRNGHGLTYWDSSGDVLANYALSYLMGQYLALQADNGQGIFKSMLTYMRSTGIYDYRAVAEVAARQIPAIRSWDDLLENWAAANILNRPSGPAGYNDAFTLTAHGPTLDPAYIGSSGIVYREVDTAQEPSDADPLMSFYFFSLVDGTCSDPAATIDCADITTGCCTPDIPYCWSDATCRSEREPRQTVCTARQLIGEGHPGIALLRGLRDHALVRTDAGRKLIALYYRHTAEVSALLDRDPHLKAEAHSLLGKLLPAAGAIGRGAAPSLPQALLSRFAALLRTLAGRGSPGLSRDLCALQNALAAGILSRDLGFTIQKQPAR